MRRLRDEIESLRFGQTARVIEWDRMLMNFTTITIHKFTPKHFFSLSELRELLARERVQWVEPNFDLR